MPNLDLNILKIMHGDTPVQKIMQGDTQVFPYVPYDSEVEYLESDGFAYILTSLYINQDTGVEVKFSWQNQSDWSFKENANNVLFGVRDANGAKSYMLFMNASTPPRFRFTAQKANGSDGIRYDEPSIVEGLHVFNYSTNSTSGIVKLDGSTLYTGTKASSYISEKPLAIFTLNKNGVFDWVACAKIYYLKLYDSGTLVMDLIPVRVGSVGYLYDKISGQLFGNAGTGNFILGADKN